MQPLGGVGYHLVDTSFDQNMPTEEVHHDPYERVIIRPIGKG